ncbi:MAG TPA: AI-2E family transporter [Burkholderiales bacterium]|nr:AI-2E family transporter [Burkholderiales bacterium]
MSPITNEETDANVAAEMLPQASDQQITNNPPPSDPIATTKIPQAKGESIEEPGRNQKPRPFVVQTPVDVRNVSLAILAVLATIAMLYWARVVLIPLAIGVISSYALTPIVDTMERWRIPRAIGAALLLISLGSGVGAAAYALGDEAAKLVSTMPDAVQKLRDIVRRERTLKDGAIDQVQKAASKLEELAKDSTPQAPLTPRGITRVQIEKPRLNIADYLWVGTLGLLVGAGEVVVVLFLVYFLLVSGDTFRRKLVKITGPTLSKKKVTVQVLDEIHAQIQRFLLIQVVASALVGVATWLAFLWIGVDQAAVWGIAAGILNSVPYVGAVVVTFGTALVGFLQFGTLSMALVVSGVTLLITSLEGFLITPWLTGRACRMNPVVVFIAVLFWGWLWGPWGLLLGVPITVVIKVVCDHVEQLASIGELLGDTPKAAKAGV